MASFRIEFHPAAVDEAEGAPYRRFSFTLFYRPTQDAVQALAVAHQRRNSATGATDEIGRIRAPGDEVDKDRL